MQYNFIALTLWWDSTFNKIGGIMLTTSCRLILPLWVSEMRKLCKRKYTSDLRISLRVICICHPYWSGYLQFSQIMKLQYYREDDSLQRLYQVKAKGFIDSSSTENRSLKKVLFTTDNKASASHFGNEVIRNPVGKFNCKCFFISSHSSGGQIFCSWTNVKSLIVIWKQ